MPVIEQLLQDLLELQEETPEVAAELTTHLRTLLSCLPSRQEDKEQEVQYVGRRRVSFQSGEKDPNVVHNVSLPLESRNMRSQHFGPDILGPGKIANRCFGTPLETKRLKRYQRVEKSHSPQTMPHKYLMPCSHSAHMLELTMGRAQLVKDRETQGTRN